MIVKICGIKTLEDALAALAAGADMLGFNFYPGSPRYLEPGDCARIVSALQAAGKKVTGVGVFVNETPERVRQVLETCALDLAQFSGDEPPASLAALHGRAFKAIRPSSNAEAEDWLRSCARRAAPALLVDAYVKGAFGGTGETGDWAVARRLAAQAPVLLAGGLTPQNVSAAIRAVRPWGVDVASGVESGPGVKDFARMAAFIAAAHASPP